MAEQNNELLMKNYGIRPTSSAPFPEVNVAVHNKYENKKYRGCGRGRGRSGGRGRGLSGGRGRGHISNRYHGAENAPIRIDIPIGQIVSAKESNPCLKRGRPLGSKDKNPHKRKGAIIQDGNIVEASAQEEAKDITNQKTPEEVQ
ncbi:hypothetical protein J1N35_007256 [Gossypium stocksii]|uniref:Uncharacterized protein n=1 Tax=Gossypium stocksii TaxID=47602 RepID=A0A9D4AFD8_9ROSI|nr:hypothetical protein J1N35_007256 [Gossypium stocksii]